MSLFKRIVMIVILLVLTGLIGYALYYFFIDTSNLKSTPDTSPNIQTSTNELPGSSARPTSTNGTTQNPNGILLPESGVIQTSSPSYYQPALTSQIILENAKNPSLSSAGDLRYYNANDGRFYRLLPNGRLEKLTDQIFYNAQKITWAKNKNQAIIEYPDSSKIIYNFDTKKQVTLPKNWQDFSFSNDGNQIAAKSLGLDPSSRWLITVQSDGTGIKLIEPMGENADKVTVSWSPNQQVAAFSQTGAPQGGERREVLFVGLNGENFKSTIVEGSGFLPQWSTTGNKLLYSVYSSRSDFKPELWIVDAQGESIGNNRQLLQLNTWADKCAFSNDDTLYCAIPRNLPTGAGMSRSIANNNSDDLFKIDLKTGLKTPIALDGDYTINTIFYDTAQNKVLFTDLNKTGVFESRL